MGLRKPSLCRLPDFRLLSPTLSHHPSNYLSHDTMAFPIPPPPKTALGYHRILSPSAGVRVSPLCLGAMNFGDAWKGFMGECDKKTTFEILDYFFENGGNFIGKC